MLKIWGTAALAGSALAVLAGTASPAHAAATTASTATALPLPPVTVLADKSGGKGGDIFISPFGDSSAYQNGAEILSPDGKAVLWSHAAPAEEEDSDFRTQAYDGQQVLTFWEGTGLGGVASGTDYIYNSHYQQIAAIKAGNGYNADGHEFLITPWNTALILSYSTGTANLTSIGGPASQAVINGSVQEIDIRTGKVLLQWNSEDHVPYSESEQPLPASASSPWDWFHINAVKVNTDGTFLIDSRDTWTTFDVSPRNGKIIWQLGGKDSSFTLKTASGQALDNAGELFSWQHDLEGHGHGIYTVFDNDAAGTANTGSNLIVNLPYSRTLTLKLNVRARVATLLASDNQPEGLSAPSQGNTELLASGGQFVGWGSLPYFSQFSASGQLVFNAELPEGVNSYRAYRLPWHPASSR